MPLKDAQQKPSANTNQTPKMVIVGAGPAGVRAAETLLSYGVKPIVIDEASRPGGQIYRQGPTGRSDARERYGLEYKRAQSIHAAGATLAQCADYRSETTVWNATSGQLDVIRDNELESIPYTHLLLATGATDRVLPFAGWVLPGVFTLGATQIALKSQHCLFGPRIVLAGTGPLLYLVAYQYARAGADVRAVVDCTPFGTKVKATPALLNAPTTFAKGLYYLGWLRARGIPIHHNAHVTAAIGTSHVEAVNIVMNGQTQQIACDALAVGHGLRSETQLADLLDCTFVFNENQRAWLPERDIAGRSSVPSVYLAGDGAGINGAVMAELAGERAALAMLTDSGIETGHSRLQRLHRQQTALTRFRYGLEHAFPQPALNPDCEDAVTICRCEGVNAGTLRRAAKQYDIKDLNRLKALTRLGMGLCQGRMCQTGAAELLAQCQNVPLSSIGRLRSQSPIKPMSLALLSKTTD